MKSSFFPVAILASMLGLSEPLESACLSFNNNLPFEVYRNSRPPINDSESGFRFFPATNYYAGAGTAHLIERSESSADRHLFLWVNRCQFASRGSVCGYIQTGNEPRVRDGANDHYFYFTSLDKADACTRAQLYYALEAENFAVNVLGRYGVTPILPDQNPVDFVNYSGGFRDICYLWAHDLKDHISGVTFDYEPQDDRPASRTNLLSDYFSRFLRDPNRFPQKNMYLYTNPLLTGGVHNGIVQSDNAKELLDLYDRVSILSFYPTDPNGISIDIAAQIYYWGAVTAAERSKIFQIVGIGSLNEEQITARRAAVFNHGLAGVAVWNNLDGVAPTCDSAYQYRVSCIVYGSCSGF